MSAIEINGLTKRFGDIVAGDDLTFRVGEGTMTDGQLLPVWAGGLVLVAYTMAITFAGMRATIQRDVP